MTAAHKQERSDRRDAHSLIAADRVEGTEVRNPAGEKLGKIETLMIDKHSGRVAYAVMSFGGFLGIGDRYHALLWGVLKYDPGLGSYVVNLDKQQLEAAPTYDRSDEIDWNDRTWGKRVHDYYQVPPFWI